MRKLFSSQSRSRFVGSLLGMTLLTGGAGCTPQAPAPVGLAADPEALSGEFVTYVADFDDGHSERWHALRQPDGHELRLDFDAAPAITTGHKLWVRGDLTAEKRMHVTAFDTGPELTQVGGALTADEPELIAAPAIETYLLVLVDTGATTGVLTTAQGQARLNSAVLTDRSFATYYSESSYGKYSVSPNSTVMTLPYTMNGCDTGPMATALEAMIPNVATAYQHVIYYFPRTTACTFGGLGEEGSTGRPSRRTWMNGSLSCVVLMQEPGHNLGLMHANTMNCNGSTFSATPATGCTITEYGSQLTTMGGGCRVLNGYERWYSQWFSGCNAVTAPGSGTYTLLPIETPCPGGTQTIQVPLGTAQVVGDPQAGANTMVNLRNFYLEFRTATGSFDTYTTGTARAGATVFAGPSVFIYVSDNVRPPTTGNTRGQSSVWTELLTMTPAATPSYSGFTTVGQSFTDPTPGGATITLRAISAASATVEISRPGSTAAATCIDGTTLVGSGAPACGAPPTGTDGGVIGTGGMVGVDAGRPGTGGMVGGVDAGRPGTGGMLGGVGGSTGVGGSSGGVGGSPGPTTGVGGSPGADGGPKPPGLVTGGCGCSIPGGSEPLWTGLVGALVVGLVRRRRRHPIE